MSDHINTCTVPQHGLSPMPGEVADSLDGRASARRRVPALAAAVVALAMAGCGQAGASQSPAQTPLPPTVAVTAAPTVATTPEPPAPTPLNPAPAEMLGRWTYEFAEGDVATVDIEATRVSIERLGISRMRLGVIGDELVLSNSNLCAGEGRYAWSLEGDTLRFNVIGTDPCDGRQKSFDGVAYTRVQG